MARKKKNQLPSGNIRVQIYAGKDPSTGKRRYKSFTAPTRQEAQAMARRWQLTHEDPEPPKPKVPTLAEAMDAFIDTCRAQDYSPSTIPGYLSIRNHSFPKLLDRPVDQITVADVQAALDARMADHSVKTVRNDFFFLKKVLDIYAPDADLRRIMIAKRKKPRRKVFRQGWGADILRYARKHEDKDFYLYCSFILSAGLRPSESYALTWDDLSAAPIECIANGKRYQTGRIDISRASVRDEFGNYTDKVPKTDAGVRGIMVDWSFFEDLYSVKMRCPGQRIFDKKPNSITKPWARCRQALGLPDWMRYYDLRHYYATSVATSGASEDELKSRMGHSTSAFSHDIYVELFEDRQASINAALSDSTKNLYRLG